jgi:hypothetical protein
VAVKSAVTKELEKLKAENAKLKAENRMLNKSVQTGGSTKRKRSPKKLFRKISVIFLISFAIALLAVGNVLFWFGNTIVKQDRFVAATQPIIKDTEVQHAMALYTTNSIFSSIDVQKVTEQVLPPKADFLAPQLTAQLKSGTEKLLQTALAKPTLQQKWNDALTRQHERIIDFATKYKGDGTISLNDVYNQLSATLSTTKLSFLANKKLPSKVGTITLVNATWLPTFHKVVTKIDTWRLLTVLLFVLTLVAGVWLARNRRKALYIFSVFASISMLATLIAQRVVRETVAGKVDPQYAEGVRHALQIFFHPFVLQTATIFVALLLIAFITWVSGSSGGALALKNQIALLFSGKLHTKLFKEENTVVSWVQKNKRVLEWLSVGVVAALMLIQRLTLKGLLLYSLLLFVLILAIEVVGGQAEKK